MPAHQDSFRILFTRLDWLEDLRSRLAGTVVHPQLLERLEELAPEAGVQVALLLTPLDLQTHPALADLLEPFDPLQLRVVFAGSLAEWTGAGLAEGLLHSVLGPGAGPDAAAVSLLSLYDLLMAGETVAALEGCLDRYSSDLDEILTIGKQLTAEKDHRRLLRLMLGKSMDLTGADAGSIFLVEEGDEGPRLRFSITDTRSLLQNRRYEEFTMPLTLRSLAGYVASTGVPLLIQDVYELGEECEYRFDPSYDRNVGYRTKSMLVVPLVNHLGQILGVIQLINAKREGQRRAADLRELEELVVPFTVPHKDLIMAIAGQAAVSIENNRLYHDIERLFEGFVEASVTAIESRDPTTSGHSFRVAELTVGLARAVDQATEGDYAGQSFSEESLKELRYASLLHDFGKVGVREEVLTKPKKLLTFRMTELVSRFEWLRQDTEIRVLRRKLEALLGGQRALDPLESELQSDLLRLEGWLRLVQQANEPSLLPAEAPAQLQEVHAHCFRDTEGQERPLLDADELRILSIPRGSLTPEEWDDMQSHVTHTWNFLRRIPWTRGLAKVPEIAYAHHEKLDGSGYPRRLGLEQIPVGSRMMTVADIYDALTAADRPYKKAVSHEAALDILNWEAGHGKVDATLLDIFVQRRVYQNIIPRV